jgi:hypothetical protein
MKNKKSFFKSAYFYILALTIVLIAVLAIFELTHVTDFYHKKSSDNHTSQTANSANSNSNQQGGATDTSETTTDTTIVTNQSDWTPSASGVITLQQPIDGATLKTGDTIRGIATVESIQYRLEDNRMGVIAQGNLSVVDGKFSGILQFTPKGTNGTLDIFTFDPSSGAEINHADINVKFAE